MVVLREEGDHGRIGAAVRAGGEAAPGAALFARTSAVGIGVRAYGGGRRSDAAADCGVVGVERGDVGAVAEDAGDCGAGARGRG